MGMIRPQLDQLAQILLHDVVISDFFCRQGTVVEQVRRVGKFLQALAQQLKRFLISARSPAAIALRQ